MFVRAPAGREPYATLVGALDTLRPRRTREPCMTRAIIFGTFDLLH